MPGKRLKFDNICFHIYYRVLYIFQKICTILIKVGSRVIAKTCINILYLFKRFMYLPPIFCTMYPVLRWLSNKTAKTKQKPRTSCTPKYIIHISTFTFVEFLSPCTLIFVGESQQFKAFWKPRSRGLLDFMGKGGFQKD